MRTDVPAGLVSEMADGFFSPVSKVFTQPNLPAWSRVALAGTPPVHCLGHDAKLAGSYILRARSGSLANPTSHVLYYARVPIAAGPSSWEFYWTQISGVDVVVPHYVEGEDAGQVAIVSSDATIQIFYFDSTPVVEADATRYWLCMVQSSNNGSSWDAPVQIAKVHQHSLQVAASQLDECFYTDYIATFDASERVPYGYIGEDIWTNRIMRAVSGWTTEPWTIDGLWYMQRLARDPEDIVSPTGDATTWGNPVWSGLGVVDVSGNQVRLATGAVLKDALAKDGSQQGVFVFAYDRDSGLWWLETTLSLADYNDNAYYFDFFVRASPINGQVWLSWLSEDEPTDVRQTGSWAVVPRSSEVVYSRSLDGSLFTELQSIDSVTADGAGPMVLVGNYLYMVGWYHIYQAAATHIALGAAAARTEVSTMTPAWSTHQTGRSPDMQITVQIADIANFPGNPGDLVSLEAGALVGVTPTVVPMVRGYIDSYEPVFSIEEGLMNGEMVALTAKPLLDTRARDNEDWLPQQVTVIEPTDQLTQISYQWGQWRVEKEDEDFWFHAPGVDIDQKTFAEISTFDPKVHSGGQWHQIAMLTHPQTLNGQITMKVRMGLRNKDYYGYTDEHTWGQIVAEYVNGFGKRWWVDGQEGTKAAMHFAAAGLVVKAANDYQAYVFAWEPGLRSWNLAGKQFDSGYSSHTLHPTTSFGWAKGPDAPDLYVMHEDYAKNLIKGSVYGSEVISTPNGDATIPKLYDGDWSAAKDNALVLYLFNGTDRKDVRRYALAINTDHGLTPGDIAELRVVTYYGQIFCFYRADGDDWALAFSYDAGVHLGAGRYGLYGRGMNGPEGSTAISPAMRNRCWWWDVEMVGDEYDMTIEDAVQKMAWRAGVELEVDAKIDAALESIPGLYSVTAMEPVIDANVTLTGKAGFILHASAVGEGAYLSLTPGDVGAGKMTLEIMVAGSPTVTIDRPSWFNIPSGEALDVRVSTRESWYSIWVGSRLVGSIYYPYQNSNKIGLFGSATWNSVRMPELFEVPRVATLDSNQSMLDSISGLLGQRRIKRFMTYDGKLRLGYFLTHDSGGEADNTMVRNALRKTDRRVNHARVHGADGWAEYRSTQLPSHPRSFVETDMPDIISHEAMYIEARALVLEANELCVQANFGGYPVLALEPEDQIHILVDAQDVDDNFLIDDISLAWRDNELWQEIGTRQVYSE